jgi:hypothetical protein
VVFGELDDPIINAFNVEHLDSLLQKIRDADRNTSIIKYLCSQERNAALDVTIMMVKSSNLSQSPQSVINGKVATSFTLIWLEPPAKQATTGKLLIKYI